MLFPTKLILPITLGLLSLTIGCGLVGPDEAHIEMFTIGPYTQTCTGAFEQECFLKFNEETQLWELFYSSIQGFDFVQGFIYKLKVRVEERETEIQDVGRYDYHLVEVISKEAASVDERPPRKP